MSVSDMKEHYQKAGEYYDKADRAPDQKSKNNYMDAARDEMGKGSKEADKLKGEINKEAQQKADNYMRQYDQAMQKGDYKTANDCANKADQAYSDAKKETNKIDAAERQARNEAMQKKPEEERHR